MKKVALLLTILTILLGCTNYKKLQDSAFSNDEIIVKDGDSYSYFIKTSSKANKSINEYNFSFKKFSGTDTLYIIKTKESTELALNINLINEAGDLKLVLIDPANNVSTIAIGTQNFKRSYLLNKGEYRLKLVGSNASGEIMLSIENNDLFKIRKID